MDAKSLQVREGALKYLEERQTIFRAGKSHSGWPGRYINVRFFLYAYPGLQATEGMKCPAHFGHTRP